MCPVSIDHQSQELGRTFIEHRMQLRSAAQKILGSRDLAEEVTQAAYLRVMEIASTVPIRHPESYCFQVVRNLAIDCRRRRQLESHVFSEEQGTEQVPCGQRTPEQIAIDQQHLSIIHKVLANLPARTREAFNLYRLNGLTQRDIASRLGVSATLVNFMIRDATDALRQCRHLLGNE
jgi:RNA polymerase sigma-70 factor (ECF subfamily)